MEKELKPCGTRAAYIRHLRAGLRGNQIDFACRLANNRHNLANRDGQNGETYKMLRRAKKRAKHQAVQHLLNKYADEYEAVFKWFHHACISEERKKMEAEAFAKLLEEETQRGREA